MSEKEERIFWPDFVRAIACVCVVIIHFNANVSNYFTLDKRVLGNHLLDIYVGTVGVNLFFMISGAMLMFSRLKRGKESLLKFYYNRFIALYPMYWIAFFIATCVTFFVWGYMPRDSVFWLLNAISGFNGYLYMMSLTPFGFYQVGEWFLGCIICLYVISPLLVCGMDKYPKVTLSCCLVFYICMLYFGVPPEFFLMYVPHMLVGMFIMKYSQTISIKTCLIASLIMIISYVIPYRREYSIVYELIVCICLFLILGGFAQYITCNLVRQVFSWIARYSYAIFLVHHKLINLLVLKFDLPNLYRRDVWMLFIIYCILTAILSKGLYHLNGQVLKIFSKSRKQ